MSPDAPGAGIRGLDAAVTGMAVLSGAGNDLAACLSALMAGQRSPGPPNRFATDHAQPYPVFQVAESALAAVTPDMLSRLPRTAVLAILAARSALADAGLDPRDLGGLRVGVAMGTTVGATLSEEDFYLAHRAGDHPDMTPFERYRDGNTAEAVAQELDLSGPCLTVTNACSSGTDAIGLAAAWIACGFCDVALAGGADELNRSVYDGFISLMITDSEPCRPFDARRKGLNLGEGAAVLVLESEEFRARRAAPVKVLIRGYGSAGDAHHLTGPRPDGRGLRQALDAALAQAGATPAGLAFVNAHGTGTRDNDRVESLVLGERLASVPFLSTKGATGHTLGAAGAVEAAFSAAMLMRGEIPASLGCEEPDPELTAHPVTTPRAIAGSCAVSTSLAFGGHNSALVLEVPGERSGGTAALLDPPCMDILGLGVVGGFGLGPEALHKTLLDPPQSEILPMDLPGGPGNAAAIKADLDPLTRHFPKRVLRRMGRFSRLALLGACEALADAGIPWQESAALNRVGLILATGYGAAQRNFAFTDSVADSGDALASPLLFSSSVANVAVSNVSIALEATGPQLTVCQWETAFAAALLTARAWLAEGRVDAVLAGGVDAFDPFLAYCGRRLHGPGFTAGEGAAFFLLRAAAHATPAWGRVLDVQLGRDLPLPSGECMISGSPRPGLPAAAWRRTFGSLPAAQALDAAVAALSLRRDTRYNGADTCSANKTGERTIHCLCADNRRYCGLVTLGKP